MNVEEAIRQRRSIRQYTQKIPPNAVIEKILHAGIWAPSGLNNQPWKFKVIKDKQHKDGLAKFTKYGGIIQSAPLVICVFLDQAATYNREKDIMAIGACIQNMLLQAYELGLGTCWLGEILNRREEVESYLKINSDCELMAVIALGYCAGKPALGCRKKLNTFIYKL